LVIVAHSMGGLVSKLLTVDSGDDFRKTISDRPLDQLTLKPEVRSELEQVVYFEREPEVRRVVFIATAHGGRQLSPSLVGRRADRLGGMPRRMAKTLHDLAEEDPRLRRLEQVATSIDELAPDAPVLVALREKRKPSGVQYHSIVGVTAEPNNIVE